jgi:hypothetical protein
MLQNVNILHSIVVVVVVVVVVAWSSEGDNSFSFKAQIIRHFFTLLPEDERQASPRNVNSILILNTGRSVSLKRSNDSKGS